MSSTTTFAIRASLLRSLSSRPARFPIETIVTTFVLVTFAYFQVIHAIKHSDFLSGGITSSYSSSLRASAHPTLASYSSNGLEWNVVSDDARNGSSATGLGPNVDLVEILFSLDEPRKVLRGTHLSASIIPPPLPSTSIPNSPYTLTTSSPAISNALNAFTEHITKSLTTSNGLSYQSLCYKNPVEAECPVWIHRQDRSMTLTLALLPSARPSFLAALDAFKPLSGNGVPRFEMMGKEESFLDMQSGKWVAYAARAFVVRFWNLAKRADSADIFIVALGYIFMYVTFFNLFVKARMLGSNFWLASTILISSIFAFILGLPIANALSIPVDIVGLSEALPFLVVTIGFDKPLRLARAVIEHPLFLPPVLAGEMSAVSLGSAGASASAVSEAALAAARSGGMNGPRRKNRPASSIVLDAVSSVGPSIARDYLLEILVLSIGASSSSFTSHSSSSAGLKEFCALAVIVVGLDCIGLFTLYVSVLTIVVEVRRIRAMRVVSSVRKRMAESARSSRAPSPTLLESSSSSASLTNAAGNGVNGAKQPQPLVNRMVDTVFGQKGVNDTVSEEKRAENPLTRLKLLILVSFLTLHILNLCTPLAPAAALHRHASYSNGVLPPSATITTAAPVPSQAGKNAQVDITTGAIGAVLKDLGANAGAEELVVRIAAPVFVRVVPATPSPEEFTFTSSADSPLITSNPIVPRRTFTTTLVMLDSFMYAWSALVGDPIISKWIVITLAVSVFLNMYLLKGLAGPWVLPPVAVTFPPSTPTVVVVEGSESGESSPVDATSGINGDRGLGHAEGYIYAPVPTPLTVNIPESTRFPRSYGSPAPRFAEAEAEAGEREEFVEVRRRVRRGTGAVMPNTANREEEGESDSATAASVMSSSSSTINANANANVAQRLEALVRHPSTLSLSASSTAGSNDDQNPEGDEDEEIKVTRPRALEELTEMFAEAPTSVKLMTDEEVVMLGQAGKIPAYALEKVLGDFERAVWIRRALISRSSATKALEGSDIPVSHYDYSRVFGACCENVVGFIPIPLGIAGPLRIDGDLVPIPMATAEGTLVASTSRGCKALNAGGGVTTVLTQDNMTRGPAIEFPSITSAAAAKMWVDSPTGSAILREAFDSTSRFARLQKLKSTMAGRTLYVRFATTTGDAMGMNMISKGTEKALEVMAEHFPQMSVLALSGNYCTDKKPAAINWIEGRGKSVVAEAVIPGKVVKSVLKTTVADLVNLNIKKNLVGSAMAGAMGGFNAHAANILTAMFLATGQDPAQNVESSNCITLMEAINDGEDLLMTCSMPSIEVGTVGGGTVLAPQGSVLDVLGLRGAHPTSPGHNARRLARIIVAAVMAGELSLMSALAAGHLIKAHMKHNRSVPGTPIPSRPQTPAPFATLEHMREAEAEAAKGHHSAPASSD